MTIIRSVMMGAIFLWALWAIILVVRRSWSVQDNDMAEVVGYVVFALAVIVIVRLLLMWIGGL